MREHVTFHSLSKNNVAAWLTALRFAAISNLLSRSRAKLSRVILLSKYLILFTNPVCLFSETELFHSSLLYSFVKNRVTTIEKSLDEITRLCLIRLIIYFKRTIRMKPRFLSTDPLNGLIRAFRGHCRRRLLRLERRCHVKITTYDVHVWEIKFRRYNTHTRDDYAIFRLRSGRWDYLKRRSRSNGWKIPNSREKDNTKFSTYLLDDSGNVVGYRERLTVNHRLNALSRILQDKIKAELRFGIYISYTDNIRIERRTRIGIRKISTFITEKRVLRMYDVRTRSNVTLDRRE